MGWAVTASCACGYKTAPLYIGGGRGNFKTYNAWPCLCPVCSQITTANLKAKIPACQKCRSRDIEICQHPLTDEGHYSAFLDTEAGEFLHAGDADKLLERFGKDAEAMDQAAIKRYMDEQYAACHKAYEAYRARQLPVQHKCPTCGQMSLSFEGAGILWD